MGPFGTDRMCSRMFLIDPDFRDLMNQMSPWMFALGQIPTNRNNINKQSTTAASYNNHISVLKAKLIVVTQK